MTSPRGYVVYRGPSALTGQPIVGLVTLYSENHKIGDMAQLWILADGRQAPHVAARSGQDARICGACPLRGTGPGTRTCYVRLDLVDQLWRRYKAGRYPDLAPEAYRAVLAVRPLRLGAYGDPAALPIALVRQLTRASAGWTGYTHQWRTAAAGWRRYLMASVESLAERTEARAAGWRTFRIGTTRAAGEIVCPASVEAGRRTTCARCRLCTGRRVLDGRPDIVTAPHGAAQLQLARRVQG